MIKIKIRKINNYYNYNIVTNLYKFENQYEMIT